MINLIKRNLEQQVLKNQDDIQALKMLGMPGVKVTDIVDSVEEIEEPISNAFYLVKNEQNTYDLYIYTNDEEFFNLGEFPKSGPQGNQGNVGPKGDTGTSTRWYSGSTFPTTALKQGDMFLDTTSYEVYMYDNEWIPQTNIKGASGRDGQNGNSIQSITNSHIDNKTTVVITTTKGGTSTFDIPDGQNGSAFHIADVYDVYEEGEGLGLPADILDLLEAAYPIANRPYSDGILVKTSKEDENLDIVYDQNYVFIPVDENNVKVYDNLGEIESIQGPPGTSIVQYGNQINVNNMLNSDDKYLTINAIPYETVNPASGTTLSGLVKILILDTEPADEDKRDGYLYFIKE